MSDIEKKALDLIQSFNKERSEFDNQAIVITYTEDVDSQIFTTLNDGGANDIVLTMANSIAQILSEVVAALDSDKQDLIISDVCAEINQMAKNKIITNKDTTN